MSWDIGSLVKISTEQQRDDENVAGSSEANARSEKQVLADLYLILMFSICTIVSLSLYLWKNIMTRIEYAEVIILLYFRMVSSWRSSKKPIVARASFHAVKILQHREIGTLPPTFIPCAQVCSSSSRTSKCGALAIEPNIL